MECHWDVKIAVINFKDLAINRLVINFYLVVRIFFPIIVGNLFLVSTVLKKKLPTKIRSNSLYNGKHTVVVLRIKNFQGFLFKFEVRL